MHLTKNMKNKIRKQSIFLLGYDLVILGFSCFLVLFMYLYLRAKSLTPLEMWIQIILFIVIVIACRIYCDIYNQVWRYGGVQSYIRLIIADAIGGTIFYLIERIFPIKTISFSETISIFSINLLISLTIRIIYRYCYMYSNTNTKRGKILAGALSFFSLGEVTPNDNCKVDSIPVAILGAGNVGVDLANSFLDNKNSKYHPNIFLEVDGEKIGRRINDIPIIDEECQKDVFIKHGIQEVIFTVDMPLSKKQKLYQRYKDFGLKIKTYDLPLVETKNPKALLREFDVEELLFRKPIYVVDSNTKKYYKNKKVLITGGGGSIGSEMARQIVRMEPKQIILLDMYENGVYDNKTDLKLAYGDTLDVQIEICSVCNIDALQKVFKTYKPDIVIHAAAHKHVPLMEHNCVESIDNNVFGTLNTVEMSEKYGVQRFVMVSTDKAVNPVNVMGATKRMCEMIVNAHANSGKTKTTFSTTRFGNVLNSAGSVIPIFKRQLAKGGPLTITDFRIIRDFMTIPEASQLVLKSSAMAKNGELFVLDMGKPVKILDLAKSIIKLSGLEPYKDIDIVETGLRPGEKLYEELLIKTENLTKTNDSLIFVEKDEKISLAQLNKKLKILRKAIEDNDDYKARLALKSVVPTFKDPEEVNSASVEAE